MDNYRAIHKFSSLFKIKIAQFSSSVISYKNWYKSAKEVQIKTEELLGNWRPFIKTITSDNGKEFANHQQIAEKLGIDFYFAKPYHSWQRGANENLNGISKAIFPKR